MFCIRIPWWLAIPIALVWLVLFLATVIYGLLLIPVLLVYRHILRSRG